MKKTTFGLLLLVTAMLITLCKPPVPEKSDTIEVTAKCDSVLHLYEEALAALQDYKFKEFQDLVNQSLDKDSAFFIANYIMAMNNLKDSAKFANYANRAISCCADLSEAEKLMKNSLEQLLADKKADVTENGKKLVALYPKDIVAYYQLYNYQSIIGDTGGLVTTLKSALDVVEDKSAIYNLLGYAYLSNDEPDSAAVALDKYIELKPDHPNPYDSKGDYFMKVEDYENAYKSYMKAIELDSTWTFSTKKAAKAKMMCDSLKVE